MLQEVQNDQDSQKQIVRLFVKSQVLEGSKTDPVRPLTVYLPKEALKNKAARFPVLYCLAAWTAAGRAQFDWQAFRESLVDRLNRLIESQTLPPCVVVAPDLYTDFGGSQYINSDYLGRHADHLVHELIPFVEKRFPVLPGMKHRGVFGRSSGGFGALRLAMDFPGVFNAIACHSGDLGFEHVYRRELISLCGGLKKYDLNVEEFLSYCRNAVKLSGHETHLLMLLGMGASYSPSEKSPWGFELPIDLKNGVIKEDVWQRWAEHDPIQRVEKTASALQQLGYLYLDCGNRDQYNLQYGGRQLAERLQALNIPHTYLEFDDNHSGTQYRYDTSLPLLLRELMP